MRSDTGLARVVTKWTDADLDVLRAHFPVGGPARCQVYLPTRSLEHITARANKLGLRFRPIRVSRGTYFDGETASKPGAPRLYRPQWQPLKPAAAVLVRPGSMDFATIPSGR